MGAPVAVTADKGMAVDNQQQHHQKHYADGSSVKSLPSLTHHPRKSAPFYSCPDLDTEQPGTPKRVSSSSKGSTGLKTQYSEDDEPLDELLAVVQPFQRFAPVTLVQDEQQHKQTVEWNAYRQAAAVIVSCLTWVIISSATILINKHIMVDLSFHFPAAVGALGMVGTTVASFLACAVFRLVPCKVTITPYFFFTRIMTTGFLIALSFQAGNTAYLYLSVAFVQMLKAFTPVSTMLYGFAFGLEKPSAKLIAAVGCITCGVLVSSYGELNFSAFGVAAMLTSIAAEGLRTVLMQHLLASKQFHPLEAWMYLGPACIIWLIILIGVVEAQQILDQHAYSIILAHKWYFAFAALAGFAVNALAMLVIKLASALTLKVLGLCKDVGLVAFGVLLLGEHVAGLQVGGYAIALVGFAAYNVIKAMPAPPAPELPRTGKSKPSAPQRQNSVIYVSSNLPQLSQNNSQPPSGGAPTQQQQQQHASAAGSGKRFHTGLTEPLLPPKQPHCSKEY